MRELFNTLQKADINTAKNYVFLDTCFLIHTFEHQKESHLKELMDVASVALTSFNVDEFILKEHEVDEKVRESMRKLLKHNPRLVVIDVPVHPGDISSEKAFVNSVDVELLQNIADASDAVLIACAIKTKSQVLTKDKHHLFTSKLENHLKKYDIAVYKEYHDILNK